MLTHNLRFGVSEPNVTIKTNPKSDKRYVTIPKSLLDEYNRVWNDPNPTKDKGKDADRCLEAFNPIYHAVTGRYTSRLAQAFDSESQFLANKIFAAIKTAKVIKDKAVLTLQESDFHRYWMK